MDDDVSLLALAGIRAIRVEQLGEPAIYMPAHRIALLDEGLTGQDRVHVVASILSQVFDRASE